MTNEMTVGELMNELAGMPEDAVVRLATQPSWPFEYSVCRDVVTLGSDGNGNRVVYLGEGSQLGYLDGEVSHALGWS